MSFAIAASSDSARSEKDGSPRRLAQLPGQPRKANERQGGALGAVDSYCATSPPTGFGIECKYLRAHLFVTPAKAGAQGQAATKRLPPDQVRSRHWIPAFAGMTVFESI
jgi:hypothetical protein